MSHRHTVETLRELIAVRRVTVHVLRRCATRGHSKLLKEVLREQARECLAAVRELQGLLRRMDAAGHVDARISGAARRGWVNLRAALACSEDGAILDVCERGGGLMLEVYRNALDDPLPDFVYAEVLRQFEDVMSGYDQIRGQSAAVWLTRERRDEGVIGAS